MVKYTGRGLVVKRPGVLSKRPDAESCLGGGGLFPSSKFVTTNYLSPNCAESVCANCAFIRITEKGG